MRFLRVTFRCFGPFEEQTLDLSEAGRLQVVFGPNETGKSSALRGLNALLFGFPGQSNDDFRFKYNQFRVHALLESFSGDQLECIRRKGNKDTLRKPCDKEVIPDRELTEFCGGLDRTQFEQLFGLDAERLVEGGAMITEGHGEFGEALFAAGAGMKGLRILTQKLEKRRGGLYLPGGRTQMITEALRHHRELVDQVRSLMLSPETYAEAETVGQKANERVSGLTDERRRVRIRCDTLNRYKAALPTIDLLKGAREQLASVADAPLLSPDFDGKLEKAREKLISATNEITGLEADRQKLQEQLQEQQPTDTVLREEKTIDELKKQVGADMKLRSEEVRAITFSIDERGKARDIFRELTGSTEWEQMGALKPRLDQRERVLELANARLAVVQEEERAESAVHQADRMLDETRCSLQQTPQPVDPIAWQELVDEISAHGPLEKQNELLSKSVDIEEQRLQAEFARFQPVPAIKWLDAPTLQVPLSAAIERFRDEVEDVQNRLSVFKEEISKSRRVLESLHSSSVERLGSEPVPTLDELIAARGDRDSGLHGVRMRLAGNPNTQLESDFSNRYAPDRPLIDSVEMSVRNCDTLADRLRHEADRVVAFHSLKQQEAALQERSTELAIAVKSVESELDAVGERWRDAWRGAGFIPDTPKVMQSWLASWSKFCDRTTTWRENSHQCLEAKVRIDALRRRLAEGCPPAVNALTLADGLSVVRRAIAEALSLRDRRTTLERDMSRLQKQLEGARERLTKAHERRQEWDKQWAAAVAVLQLKEGIPSIETAQNYLARIDQMQQHLRDMRIKEARVKEIRNERELLLEGLNGLRLRLDPAALPTTAESLETEFRALEVALGNALEKRARHQELSKQLQGVEKKIDAANKSQREARAALQALADESRVMVDDLPTAVQRARQRAQETDLVRRYEEALAQHAQNEPIEQFVANALAGRAELDQGIEELQTRVNQLDTDVSQAEAQAREAGRILAVYSQASDAAAEAKQQAASIAARLEDQVKEYAALHLARAALDKAKESYRTRHQDTLLDRAGAFFQTLTNSAFSGIEVDYEEGQDVLKAVRSAATRPDARVPVEGLSDGTRDQLFLALRLAGVEQHLKEREPLPLIIDDVLINFDDDRTGATLRCLAELAKQTQIVVFTHHRHLVELASKVDPSAYVIDLVRPV